jgi:hypothetical protein
MDYFDIPLKTLVNCGVEKTRSLAQKGRLHTGHIVPRSGETVDCFKTGRLVGIPKRHGAPPPAHSAIRWCEREGKYRADVIIVIEGFYNG